MLSFRKAVSAFLLCGSLFSWCLGVTFAAEEEQTLSAAEKEEIAKKSSNPLSDIWMLWMQNDTTILSGDALDAVGEGNQVMNSFKFQPVMSFPLFGDDWNLIVRPVFQLQTSPLGSSYGLTGDAVAPEIISQDFDGSTTGLGDTVLLTLVGPNRLDGFIWGVGLTQMFPTATDDMLGSEQWAAGPAVLVASMAPKPGGFNIGALAQHWWSYAGDDDRADVNHTDIQYFINYRLDATKLIGMSPNIKINWDADSDDKVTFPVGLGYSDVYFFGKLPIRIAAEIQYSVIKPDNVGAEWNFRFMFIPVVPNLAK